MHTFLHMLVLKPICFNKGNYYWVNMVAAIAVMSFANASCLAVLLIKCHQLFQSCELGTSTEIGSFNFAL